jgi:hypothetical protein
MSTVWRRPALPAIVSDESDVLRLRAWLLSRIRLLRWRDDDQLRHHRIYCAGGLPDFTNDARDVARDSGMENPRLDGRRNRHLSAAGADNARTVVGIRLLG